MTRGQPQPLTKGEAMLNQKIKTGKTGPSPKITKVLFEGTAEVTNSDCARVPAALVDSTQGRYAIVQLIGNDFEQNRWWDARVTGCREWENRAEELVSGHLADQIDAVLATADDSHERAYKDLNGRLARGTYHLTTATMADAD